MDDDRTTRLKPEPRGKSETHRSNAAGGRGSRDGAARLPQSVSEHGDGGSEGGRVVSLKERCNWEERRREKEEKRVVDGWEGRALFGVGRQARTGWH